MKPDLEKFLKDELKRDADKMMREVDADPDVADVEVPTDVKENLLKQIRELEAQQTNRNYHQMEDQLIEDGLRYRKGRKRRKYYVAGFALLLVTSVSFTSVGGPSNLLKMIERTYGNRELIMTNTDNEDIVVSEVVDEREAYDLIEEKLGFKPVRFYYIPDGAVFDKLKILREVGDAYLSFKIDNEERLIVRMQVGHTLTSMGIDYEDEILEQYYIQNEHITALIKEYRLKDTESTRWTAHFLYRNVQYMIVGEEMDQSEFEKIVNNLYFF